LSFQGMTVEATTRGKNPLAANDTARQSLKLTRRRRPGPMEDADEKAAKSQECERSCH